MRHHKLAMRVQVMIEIDGRGVKVCAHGDVDATEKPLLASRIFKAAKMLATQIERCALLAGCSYPAALSEIRKSGTELPVMEVLTDTHVNVPGPDEVN